MNFPALFPTPWTNDSDVLNHAPDGTLVAPGETVQLAGATLRDFFAAQAMHAMLTTDGDMQDEDIAMHSYKMADVMLKARQS